MRYTIQKTTLESIADAIRAKTETTGKMSPAQMATAISTMQTGVQPVGISVQGKAGENINAGEFVTGTRVDYKRMNTHSTTDCLSTMKHIGIDPNGNDLYAVLTNEFNRSNEGQLLVFFKREGDTFTELKQNKDILITSKAQYWYRSSIKTLCLIPNTNKLFVVIQDQEPTNSHYFIATAILQIDWSTYALTAVTEAKLFSENYDGEGKMCNNDADCLYDSATNCIYFIHLKTGSPQAAAADQVFNVIQLNSDYTDFTWYETVISGNMDSGYKFFALDESNHIYLVYTTKYYSTTSSSTKWEAVYIAQINNDYTVTVITGLTNVVTSSSYYSYGKTNLIRLDNNHFAIFATTWSNPYRLGSMLITINSDYTITTKYKDSYYLPGTSTYLQARQNAIVKLLPDNKISLIVAATYIQSTYKYVDPIEIIFSYDYSKDDPISIVSATSVEALGYFYNGSFRGVSSVLRGYTEYIPEENIIVTSNDVSAMSVTIYHDMVFTKASTVISGIAMNNVTAGNNLTAVLKG